MSNGYCGDSESQITIGAAVDSTLIAWTRGFEQSRRIHGESAVGARCIEWCL